MLTDGTDEKLGSAVPDAENEVRTVPDAENVDPWAAAFASLEKVADESDEGDTSEDSPEPAGGAGSAGPADGPAAGDSDPHVGSDDTGGSVPPAAGAGDSGGAIDISAVEARLTEYTEEIENRAIDEVHRMFLERADENGNRLIRQTDGRLGATINDPDIYRVDPNDGTIAFYNPDTGRPFTGDNPRAQAKAWVESYNEELRETFNRVAEKHKAELEKSVAPAIEMLKFTPKYEKLDDVRRTMFDALIEGYEVYDESGNHIGYSTDLDKALERVNKQVEAMKSKRPAAAMETQSTPPTGPAVDMPTSGSGNSGGGEVVDSLEKAMLLKQEAILNNQKKR